MENIFSTEFDDFDICDKIISHFEDVLYPREFILLKKMLSLGYLVGGAFVSVINKQRPKDFDIYVSPNRVHALIKLLKEWKYNDKTTRPPKPGMKFTSPRNLGLFSHKTFAPVDVTILKDFDTIVPSIVPCYNVNGLMMYKNAGEISLCLSYKTRDTVEKVYYDIKNKVCTELKLIYHRREKIIKKKFKIEEHQTNFSESDFSSEDYDEKSSCSEGFEVSQEQFYDS